jgi:hypothetical protein
VLTYPAVKLLDVSGPAQVFATANDRSAAMGSAAIRDQNRGSRRGGRYDPRPMYGINRASREAGRSSGQELQRGIEVSHSITPLLLIGYMHQHTWGSYAPMP